MEKFKISIRMNQPTTVLRSNSFLLSVVVPAYNEQDNIFPIVTRLQTVLQSYPTFEVIFVDDGSTDNTLGLLQQACKDYPMIQYISLSRNFGHQNALKAGLDHARGDCVISMDADLQHPPALIPQLIERWLTGYDVVYTIREDTEVIGWWKKYTAKAFYWLMNSLTDVKVPAGAADFRLLDRRVVNALKQFPETFLFFRGLVAWIGFKQTSVHYQVQPRFSGNSKYSVRAMITFALNGVTSFSIIPLRLSSILGALMALCALLYAMYAVYQRLFSNVVISGWTSVLVSILLIGGLQLIMFGVLGEYIGKLFLEIKRRPAYIIQRSSYVNE